MLLGMRAAAVWIESRAGCVHLAIVWTLNLTVQLPIIVRLSPKASVPEAHAWEISCVPAMLADREIMTKDCLQGLITLARVGREVRLRRAKLREEGQLLDAGSGDVSGTDQLRRLDKLPQIVPIECGGIVEMRYEGFRIGRVVRLPELEHDDAADE